jgi:2-keto-myo-inositol isomerase
MLNRRKLLQLAALSTAAAFMPKRNFGAGLLQDVNDITPDYANSIAKSAGFTFCLNMATIMGHKLGFVKELQTASKAGFRSVEIWMDSFQKYLDNGGSTREAAKIINDLGLTVKNCIGFSEWIVDDETRRNKAIEQLKKEMDLLAAINCKRTAAPPMGATDGPVLDRKTVAERYRNILEIGSQKGVIPQLEMWGFSTNLNRASEVAYVAMESGHPAAKVLLDVFHLYKGGTSLETLHFVNPSGVDIFHMNDYPANISRSEITDADRIYPGDGIAPLDKILSLFRNQSKPIVLSFEVFNANYYKQDALVVAQTALRKMTAVTEKVKTTMHADER